jgi:hypothetical protein
MDLKQERNAELPFSLLELIVGHLGPRDRAALALTHSTFATFLRATRKRCVARVADRQQLKMLSSTLQKHKALESLNIVFLEDKPLLSSLSFMSPTTTSLELQFRGEHPTKRSLSWLNSNLFCSVQRLCLDAGRSSARRLNDGQQLSILAGLPSLTDLELVNLHSDRGLEKVTQVRNRYLLLLLACSAFSCLAQIALKRIKPFFFLCSCKLSASSTPTTQLMRLLTLSARPA